MLPLEVSVQLKSSENVGPQTVVPSGRTTSTSELTVPPAWSATRTRTWAPLLAVNVWQPSSPGSSIVAAAPGLPRVNAVHPSGAGNRSTTSR